MALSDYYDTTFSIMTNTGSKDAGGAIIPGATVLSAGNLGKVDMLGGSREIVNEQNQVLADFILFCDSMVMTTENDILITASPDVNLNNQTFQIHKIDSTTLRGLSPHMEVYLRHAK